MERERKQEEELTNLFVKSPEFKKLKEKIAHEIQVFGKSETLIKFKEIMGDGELSRASKINKGIQA